MPEGIDPDEYYTKYGKELFVKYLEENQLDKIDYLYHEIKKKYNLNLPSEKIQFRNDIFNQIKDLKSNAIYELYLKKLSKDIEISYESLANDFKVTIGKKAKKTPTNTIQDIKVLSKYELAEKILASYVIKERSYQTVIRKELGEFFAVDPRYKRIILRVFDMYDRDLIPDSKAILADLGYEESTLLSSDHNYQVSELKECIRTLKNRNLEDELKDLNEQMENTTDLNEKLSLGKQIIKIRKQMNR